MWSALFLHDLCIYIADFISSNLSKICESVRNLAEEANRSNLSDFSDNYFDELPVATHESTLFHDAIDQVVPDSTKIEDISSIELPQKEFHQPKNLHD